MEQKVTRRCEIETGLRHQKTRTLSVNPAVNGYIFQIRLKGGKGIMAISWFRSNHGHVMSSEVFRLDLNQEIAGII